MQLWRKQKKKKKKREFIIKVEKHATSKYAAIYALFNKC